MSLFTNDIGTGFLRLMHNISAIVLSISSAFYGYARAVAYVSQVIGVLINWFINLGRVILSNDKLITVLATVTIGATLIGVLYKLGTAIYGVISSFGALGITLGGTFTMLAGLIALIGMLATGFLNLGNIIDEFSKFKNDMVKCPADRMPNGDLGGTVKWKRWRECSQSACGPSTGGAWSREQAGMLAFAREAGSRCS